MRIRTLEQLREFLDGELAWRKRELSALGFSLDKARAHEKTVLAKAAICLLYAHWDGFVRAAAAGYASFVAAQGLRYRDLSPPFAALGLRADILRAAQSNRLTDIESVASKMIHGLEKLPNMNWETAVYAGANLNSDRLEQMLCLIGQGNQNYAPKSQLLDDRLLGNRNRIAHGRRVEVDEGDYAELRAEIIQLVDMFRNDVENAAALGVFRR